MFFGETEGVTNGDIYIYLPYLYGYARIIFKQRNEESEYM